MYKRQESDSVAVRVAVAEFDDRQQEEFEAFVVTTDPKLPLEVRKRLDANGLRVSVISNVNSAVLQRLLAPQAPDPKWLTDQELELAEAGKLDSIHRLTSQRRVEKRRGESFTMPISPLRAKSTWQIFNSQQAIPGHAILAQCQMRITSWPQPDGSVRVRLLPEIHHGQELSRIGVDEQNFSVRQSREIEELRSLAFEMSIRPGETILVAPTARLERMGKLFFDASRDDSDAQQLVAESSVTNGTEEMASELFPMLTEEDSLDPLIQVDLADLDTVEQSSDRPQPWQRILLVRVAEVTPPATGR